MRRSMRRTSTLGALALVASLAVVVSPSAAPAEPATALPFRLTQASAFDVSPPLRELANVVLPTPTDQDDSHDDLGPIATDTGYTGDGALQNSFAAAKKAQDPLEQISAPRINFEGVANSANPILISPPDPNSAVGPNHIVTTVNVQYAVYSKTGAKLLGPAQIGTLFAGFPIPGCDGFNGDPVVLYDHQMDRWLITQFTVDGPEFWNC